MGNTVKVNTANLSGLPAPIARPTYDRTKLKTGIVHISLGAFHRAHQAVYTDDLLAKDPSALESWGLCSVGALPHDQKLCSQLSQQNNLYTVVTRDRGGMKARVIGSLADVKFAPDDRGAVLAQMAKKTTKIVSLTVTERGYGHDPATGKLDTGRSDVAADLTMPKNPKTALGMVVEALDQRRRAGLAPFTVMSCDNLQKNGSLTRALTLEIAEHRDPSLAKWIEENGAFPNSMVDRITPATSANDITEIREHFGIDDAAPVVCEPFRQWVLEDEFTMGRPAWDEVGAQFVSDVYPYELTKLRLLNVAHSSFCYLGVLAGYDFVHEAITDPGIQRFVRRLMDEEITPTLPDAPGIDLPSYKNMLIERFANPAIRDGLPRICMDGSQKIGNQMMPIVRDRLAAGGSVDLLGMAVASFIRCSRGTDEHGKPIEVKDPLADKIKQAAKAGGDDPTPFLAIPEIFGSDLPQAEAFTKSVDYWLKRLHKDGAKAAVAEM